ncbi:phage baseplate assembly protein V [Budvicia aquatica]|uniref:Phage P2 baseplate assembly protein gpV n=1 Tax=Budvicia aquatica TaxID=82979 RepID=A0A2C6DKL7_9GAMM|nr:phage baseplate assembly protein V [Budvicia aquatica]PHI29243.1 phage baseplate assembly protein V [Budvicia aquatica]VFS47457.1 Phage P2 baseplate assembly protein gpV [Budvicia aquatica]
MNNLDVITDLRRRLDNLLRIGVISALDPARPYCRVKTGELETGWIKWICQRAGGDSDWWPPTVGEQVLLLCLGGELTTAFALVGIYSDDNPPPSLSPTARKIKFSDGAVIEYEAATSTLNINGAKTVFIDNADKITASAGTKIMLNSPVVECSSLLITQSLQVNGGGTMKGNINHSGGSFSSNGVVVDTHIHDGVKQGGDTSGGPR